MSESTYSIRKYGEKVGDYQLADEWMRAHGRGPFPESLVPALGVFALCQPDETLPAEEIAACWLSMDNSIGVCTLDFALTRPGLTPKQAYQALEVVFDFLTLEAQSMNYGMMAIYAPPGLARFAERAGFTRHAEGLVMLRKNITPAP